MTDPAAAKPVSPPAAAAREGSTASSFKDDLIANCGRYSPLFALKSLFLEPSFLTIRLYRLSVKMHRGGHTKLAKVLWRFNVVLSGCYLSPESTVGSGLALPHPTGVVIGEGARLGDNVTIYQGVTIGRTAKSVGYPVVRSGATLFANSILLGDVEIGENAVVGAGAVVVGNVPPGATVVGVPAHEIVPRAQAA